MRQLVQLQKNASTFKSLGAELIFVFREERDGVEGLKKIQQNHPTDYTLAIDFKNQATGSYSPKRMTFDNYVVDSSGDVRGIIDGTLRDRATAAELIKVLKQIQADSK